MSEPVSTSALSHPVLAAMLARRSNSKIVLDAPPSDEQLQALLRVAATVPDHGQVRPYRLMVVRGDARARFGQALVDAAREAKGELPPAIEDKLRGKAQVAPMQIVLIASVQSPHKIPEWEQLATAACTGYAIVLAADALGLAAVWKSAPYLEGAALQQRLGLAHHERLLGWINVGTPREPAPPRPLAEPSEYTVELTAE